MAWTQADIDKLDAAIAGSGSMQSMTFGDETYQFRSLEEMLRLRKIMTDSVNAASGASGTSRLASTSKGL